MDTQVSRKVAEKVGMTLDELAEAANVHHDTTGDRTYLSLIEDADENVDSAILDASPEYYERCEASLLAIVSATDSATVAWFGARGFWA